MSTARPSMVESDTASRTSKRERRGWERYSLTDTEGKLIYRHQAMNCRLIDISLGGCCIRTEKRFTHGALAKVEVHFHLHGLPQRIAGITQWTSKGNELGIRFEHASPRTKNEFVALLTGLFDEAAAEAVREAALAEATTPVASTAPSPSAASSQPPLVSTDNGSIAAESAEPSSQAVIHFLKDGSQSAGDVIDLSMEGCTLRLVRPFTVGIYVRVEISFHIRGLVFQLAGVSQEIHDKHTVTFRFLDMSRRRREELTQAIEERRAEKPPQS